MTTLILIPTDFERRRLGQPLVDLACRHNARIELCGFGPVAAAARTAQLLGKLLPTRVCLLGIAGTYEGRVPVGSATRLTTVACHGIGAGSGTAFRTAGDLGWSQAELIPDASGAAFEPIGDVIQLERASVGTAPDEGRQTLLTVCAASASADEVEFKLSRFPDAIAEDMEGFGVAVACRLADVPLTIIRGISNVAGDRDSNRWQIDAALQSALIELRVWLDE